MAPPAPTEMIISGTPRLPPKKRARRRSPWAVPSTPSSTVAPETPCAHRASTTAVNGSPRPQYTVSFASPSSGAPAAGSVSIRARSSVTRPARPWSSSTAGSTASIRSRASTATLTSGRSSDSVSRRWLWSRCRSPKPSVPRSSTLVRSASRP